MRKTLDLARATGGGVATELFIPSKMRTWTPHFSQPKNPLRDAVRLALPLSLPNDPCMRSPHSCTLPRSKLRFSQNRAAQKKVETFRALLSCSRGRRHQSQLARNRHLHCSLGRHTPSLKDLSQGILLLNLSRTHHGWYDQLQPSFSSRWATWKSSRKCLKQAVSEEGTAEEGEFQPVSQSDLPSWRQSLKSWGRARAS